MQNKKSAIFLGLILLLVAAAAFAAGRMITQGLNPLGLLGLTGNGLSSVTDILPAEELPKIPPEVEGLFVERQDNVIFVQGSGLNQGPDGVEVGSPEDIAGGPKTEVLITAETVLYRDTTQPPSERPSNVHNPAIQQTVIEGTLDDLMDSQTYLMVWGRKSGDRVIAEVLVYSDLSAVKGP
jgi:hypothetical protein